MSTTLNALLEMGFSKVKAEKALAASGDQGIEAAMEWLLEHNDDVEMEVELDTPAAAAQSDPKIEQKSDELGDKASAAEAEVKSYKCLDCNKQFKSDTDLEFHAVKSGHVNFEESTDDIRPLTEEEKQAQLCNIQERMKKRREERLEREKMEAIELEKNRRRMGQELALAKQKLEEQEMKRVAEEKRREKMEAKLARQKVLEQIERDKQARKEKFGMVSPNTAETTPPKPQQPVETPQPQPKKDYDQCRLQIRLPNGQALTQSFKPQEELAAVRLYVEMNRTDGNTDYFSLMTNFPKKIFTEEDMCKPLSALGLVPSAVLIVRKGA